jgi:hypothetical protein
MQLVELKMKVSLFFLQVFAREKNLSKDVFNLEMLKSGYDSRIEVASQTLWGAMTGKRRKLDERKLYRSHTKRERKREREREKNQIVE